MIVSKLVDRVRADQQDVLRKRIEEAAAEQGGAGGLEGPAAYRFLMDLDIFVNMRGPEFIYSRGIAESLRVGEDIFELAYVLKKAMQ
jgi:hypothetical protein